MQQSSFLYLWHTCASVLVHVLKAYGSRFVCLSVCVLVCLQFHFLKLTKTMFCMVSKDFVHYTFGIIHSSIAIEHSCGAFQISHAEDEFTCNGSLEILKFGSMQQLYSYIHQNYAVNTLS